jgi:monoamine oxidase
VASGGERAYDVVVVGGGLAGLTAARELDKQGRSVIVLDARAEVGGRMVRKSTASGVWVDLGGQWIGPSQDRISALAGELGVRTYDSFHDGLTTFFWKGKRSTFDGDFPPFTPRHTPAVTPEELADTTKVWSAFETMSSSVPPAEPWKSPDAGARDGLLVSKWLDAAATTGFSRFVVTQQARIGGNGGFEPDDVSLLHMLWTDSTSPQREEPEKTLFIECAGQIPKLIVDRFSTRVDVRVNAPVRRIAQDATGVTVRSDIGDFPGSKVIVAMPASLAGLITYDPPLPQQRAGFTQNARMGAIIKNHAVYERPFWRDEGLNGTAICDLPTVQFIADSSPPGDGHGILTSFIAGDLARSLSKQSPDARKSLVLADYEQCFGNSATNPIDYIEKDWLVEPWVGGAFTEYLTPKTWTTYGPAWSKAVGHIHWAGTESADQWAGYFDGAVRSGEKAAHEIQASL